jgi:crotonobetainyl-CoA:carnitine CoA-transferase CaiB-like acyl-CoA transferase
LDGIKVVELAEWVAVPSGAAILADWGADVVKIEHPKTGDHLRGLKAIQGVRVGDVHVWFEVANRNKRGIALDLSRDASSAVLDRLIANADVFMTNYRVRALRKLGITYARFKEVNPRLIFASLTGFGHQGPDSEKPGYDYAGFWARAGFMSKLGDGMPYPPYMRPGQGDNTTSMIVAGAISAALYARERTGVGQELELSLYHTGVWVLNMDVQARLGLGREIPTQPRHASPNPLWNTYLAKDGRWLQLVMLEPLRHWPRFCLAIGREDLADDPRAATVEALEQHCGALIAIIDEEIAKKTAAEWKEIMSAYDLVFQQGNTITDVVEDPQAWENGFFAKVEHPVMGELTTVASPARFHGTPASVRTSAPEIGQHTEEVLMELGYEWEQIEALKEQGVIP